MVHTLSDWHISSNKQEKQCKPIMNESNSNEGRNESPTSAQTHELAIDREGGKNLSCEATAVNTGDHSEVIERVEAISNEEENLAYRKTWRTVK